MCVCVPQTNASPQPRYFPVSLPPCRSLDPDSCKYDPFPREWVKQETYKHLAGMAAPDKAGAGAGAGAAKGKGKGKGGAAASGGR